MLGTNRTRPIPIPAIFVIVESTEIGPARVLPDQDPGRGGCVTDVSFSLRKKALASAYAVWILGRWRLQQKACVLLT